MPESMFIDFFAWALLPAWLMAGACDYLCHRASDIGHTSGPPESWLHLAQFATLLIALGVAVAFKPSMGAFVLMVGAVLLHSVLSMIDVSYTLPRRFVSVFEHFVHGFMDVIPLIAVALWIWGHWDARMETGLSIRGAISAGGFIVLGIYTAVAGLPIAEELLRTHRQHHDLKQALPPSDRTR
jgi:hypothetical protein